MVKTEQQQDKATDVYTGNIYNLLTELKQSYAQYYDYLLELNIKGKNNEDQYTEQEQKNIIYSVKIIRQTITMLDVELKTLQTIGKIKKDENLDKIRSKWQESKSYLPEPEIIEEYIISINIILTKQILKGVYTDINAIYSKN